MNNQGLLSLRARKTCAQLRGRRALFLTGALLTICAAPSLAATAVTFDHDIRPFFEQACSKCHGDGMAMAGLKLTSESAVLQGGKSGPAIVPGKSGDSLLLKRILGLTDAPRMPMGGNPLSSDQVALIRQWIDQTDFTAARRATPKSAAAPTSTALNSERQSPLFADQVRPILASRCYGCHGPDNQQAGLRLDSLPSVLKGSESGKVVIPGHSDESRLIRRLLAKERPQMPYGGPPLTQAQIDTIRKWIDAGTPGPDSSQPLAAKPLKHWAYVKPLRPAVPEVQMRTWVRNPIDNFILAKLESEKLRPSPEADKPTLIRRVYLDLIGLPPTPKEVDDFIADTSPDAYEKVVDRLLASPHYGERWARQWLDMARYADTNGYEKDNRRTAWEYRDWVIRALNRDMPFTEFTIDQIAGDMLPHPTSDQLVATGFHRNTLLNQEGGVDPEEYYWYELVDRVNTTASVWLGSTLGCAECHNHKFDPFTQKDYYRFLAFFSDSKYTIQGPPTGLYAQEPELELPTPEQKRKSEELRGEIAKLKKVLDTQTPQLDEAQRAWEAEMRSAPKSWTSLRPGHLESAGGAELKLLPDGSVLASGKNPQADTYTLSAQTTASKISGLRIEVLNDPSLPNGGPGRDNEGNFFLSAVDVQIAPINNPERRQPVVWQSAKADESQTGYDIANLTKENKEHMLRGWAIDASRKDDASEKNVASYKDVRMRQAVLVAQEPFGFPGGTILTITLKHEMKHASRNIGRFRLSVTSTPDPQFITRIPAGLRPLLAVAPSSRTAEQQKTLSAAYHSVSPLLEPTRKQIDELNRSLKDLGIATAMIMEEKPGYTRPAAYMRERGSFMSKGELVYADTPFILNPLPRNAMPNRLRLAEWLVSEDNPLTARVAVNHFWEAIFGHGIVETAEDFGTQGDPPSHPELLDWLATGFMRQGWSMKKIQRLMVTSATYRQSSRASKELLARDPYNKLYARSARFREEAEMVHDIALSVSGLLSGKMYGPSVFPYQPEGIWDVPYSNDRWVESKGEDRYRRAIYTFIRRSAPYPSLITYDAPSREFCTIRRVRTNTPLQALTTLNDPYFFDAARGLAKRMVNEGGATNPERAAYAFRLCVSRRPAQGELDRVLAFYNRQLAAYQRDHKSALAAIGATSDVPGAPELAAWTTVANVLLNMDETISKE
jgi:mono/diheme cytochrome c family protein